MIRDMFDEMTNKFGFDDGCLVPAGAEAYRDLLVNLINIKFEGTALEARDGSTGHNPVTIYFWDKENDCVCSDIPDMVEDFIDEIDDLDEDPIENLIEVKIVINPKAVMEIESFVHWLGDLNTNIDKNEQIVTNWCREHDQDDGEVWDLFTSTMTREELADLDYIVQALDARDNAPYEEEEE